MVSLIYHYCSLNTFFQIIKNKTLRRTFDIKQLFDQKKEFEISEKNIIIEADFIKAAKSLKDSRQRQIQQSGEMLNN